MSLKTLTWTQVNGWRLSQHYLTNRLERPAFLSAATRMGGVQAQVLSAAGLAMWARVHCLTSDEISAALWKDRKLVKTWAMRGTLHLFAASDIPLYIAAQRAPGLYQDWSGYFEYYGMSRAQMEAYYEGVSHVLSDQPITREQLASGLAKHTGVPALRDLILNANWGGPLKPLAFRGELAFGPNQGQNVTFVSPRAWLGAWQEIDPQEAFKTVARLYLQGYGPASSDDFARWWGGGAGKTLAKKLFASLGDEIEEVEVEGWRGFALRDTLEAMQTGEPSGTVHLLPLFDMYTFWHGRDVEALLPKKYKPRVFRPQGWISATVLVDGFIRGVWEYKAGKARTTVKVSMFEKPSAKIKKGIKAEAERLGEFFGSEIALEYA